ncbi:MAG: FAD-dependent oxidoreductase, partial [Deltaproteobacteria bacterium]|nr:FAD-dependent oxidoreductase [Deltaproteobacteria bacterium]
VLEDSNRFRWHLDSDIEDHDHSGDNHTRRCINREPLLINTVGAWASRPEAVTSIPNLFLASDYVRTHSNLATMEGANEAARHAVNGILDASGSSALKCSIWPLHRSPFLAPLRELDRIMLAADQKHVLELLTEGSLQDGVRYLHELVGSDRWHLVGTAEQVARMMRRFPGVERLQLCLGARPEPVKPQPAKTATTILPAANVGKTKIAILGGGIASIAAAFKLTSTPELRDKNDITIYQLGWRIGGKGASGRNSTPGFGDRIEEHGFHVWFGFYDNAFRMMRECYQELDRDRRLPLATLDDAFKPAHTMVLLENYKGGWRQWQLTKPGNSFEPGDTSIPMPFWWDVLADILDQMVELWNWVLDGMSGTGDPTSFAGTLIGGALRMGGMIAGGLGRLVGIVDGLEHARRIAYRVAKNGRGARPDKTSSDALINALNDFKERLWCDLVEPNLDTDEIRHLFYIVDFVGTIARGIIADELADKGLNSVNDETLIEWLERHGARRNTLDGPIIKLLHDAQFCYRDGDVNQPDYAAGAALNAILRAFFTYKGALYYKMQAGMGDTVFAPFYEVLHRRGVKFKFFHAVDKLHLSPDKNAIESIDVIRQVKLRGDDYRPLVSVKGLPCWPNEPLWDQIVSADADEIRSKHINLEHELNPLGRQSMTLRRGDHFDKVILGIPVAALEPICAELIANREKPAFKRMLDNACTTMTQAFQVWMTRTTDGLGWQASSNSIMSCYSDPMDSYCIMTHLISRENWPLRDREDWPLRDGPLSIGYFCSVLSDERGDTQKRCNDRVKQNAVEFIKHRAAPIWPYAVQGADQNFNWELLYDSQNRQGPSRFDSQFWVANFQPSERFALSPAKQVKYRLKTDESGYSNLFLAGDWIRTGFDVACVESAVMSGLQAARAITGSAETIIGENDHWLAKMI